jgi:hypothetical protein
VDRLVIERLGRRQLDERAEVQINRGLTAGARAIPIR